MADGHQIGIATPVLAELVAGIEKSQTRDRNMKRLLTNLGPLKLWPFDRAAAFRYGELYAQLVALGRPIGTIDMMIAAVAGQFRSCVVVSADNDLRQVPGLNVENWRG